MCGYPKDDHVEEAIEPGSFLGQSWDGQRHMREVPTDAFGNIDFGGFGKKQGKVNALACCIQLHFTFVLYHTHSKL